MTEPSNSALHTAPDADYEQIAPLTHHPKFELMIRIMEAIEDNEDAGMCTCALKDRINDVIDGTYVRPDDNFDTWVDEAMAEMAEEKAAAEHHDTN